MATNWDSNDLDYSTQGNDKTVEGGQKDVPHRNYQQKNTPVNRSKLLSLQIFIGNFFHLVVRFLGFVDQVEI